MVKTIWSNDQVRPGPEHGDNQHHSQKQQIQQCTQHCSHVQSHYQFTLSQNITTSCYCSTTSLDRTLPTYCLAEWRPRPPSMEPCEGVDGIVGPSYGPSLRGRQDSNFLGTRVPILLCCGGNKHKSIINKPHTALCAVLHYINCTWPCPNFVSLLKTAMIPANMLPC